MINAKGAAPIAKNVIVVDENGNQYEATYPKRARNLVKTAGHAILMILRYVLRVLRQ